MFHEPLLACTGEDGSVRCWQPAAVPESAASAAAAPWEELPPLRSGSGGGSAGVQHLCLVSQQPLQLGARIGADSIVIWDLTR